MHVSGGFEIAAQFIGDVLSHEVERDDAAHRTDEFLNPSCVLCSAQLVGSRDARRIKVMALSCCGCRPFTMAVVMSGASQGRRKRL